MLLLKNASITAYICTAQSAVYDLEKSIENIVNRDTKNINLNSKLSFLYISREYKVFINKIVIKINGNIPKFCKYDT